MLLDWLQWNVVKILRWYFPTYMESIQKIAIFRDYEKASILIFPSFIRTNAIYFWTWILWYLSRKLLKYWRVYCSQRLEGPGEAVPCPNRLFHIQVTTHHDNNEKDNFIILCLGCTTPSPCLPASHSPFLSQPGFSTWPIGQLVPGRSLLKAIMASPWCYLMKQKLAIGASLCIYIYTAAVNLLPMCRNQFSSTRQYVGNPIDCVHTKDIPEVLPSCKGSSLMYIS